MSRRQFFVLPILVAMSAGPEAKDRPPDTAHIGILSTGHIDIAVYRELESLLRESVPQHALDMTYREAAFSKERLAAQLDELLARHLDVLVCMDLFAATYAQSRRPNAGPPVVFLAHADPLASHLIHGYSEPGNNLTGVTTYRCVDGKMVEIMADAFPARKRLGYFLDSSVGDDKDCVRLAEDAAARNHVELVKIDVSAAEFLPTLSSTLSTLRLDAIVAPASAAVWQNRKAVVESINAQRLPAIYEDTIFLDQGGLMSYGPVETDAIPQLVRAVGKILRGEPAGSIPVEQPTLFELVVNLHAPHASEYALKASTLRRADRILE